MVHYFYGEDTYRAREAAFDVARRAQATVRWLDRRDLEAQPLADTVGRGSGSLFGQELLVIRDVGALPHGLQQDLLAVLAAAEETIDCVLWDRGTADRRSPVYRHFGKQGTSFAAPRVDEAVAWLVAEATQRAGEIDASAAKAMIERLGVDRWRLSSELDKLLLVSSRITVALVQSAVAESLAAEIFTLLDALARGSRGQALRSMRGLLTAGNSEFYILSMLAYQFRTLHAIRRGIEVGQDQATIAREAGIKPYAVQKNYPHAKRFSEGYLREALTRILATDFAIRRGAVDQRTAVCMLVLSLASR